MLLESKQLEEEPQVQPISVSGSQRSYFLGSFVAQMSTDKERHLSLSQSSSIQFVAADLPCLAQNLRNRLNFKTMKIKGYIADNEGSLKLPKLQSCGHLMHCFDEIWFFLLREKYVSLIGHQIGMPQDMAAKESRMKIALVEVDVFLQQRAVDDAYELGLTNNNTSSELIPTTSSHPERSLEQLKWARLSLLLLLELMGVRKEQDCKINSGRQFSGFFRLVDHARLSKVILSPFRGMLRLVTHDARKLLYYLTPPQQTPLPLPPDPASDDAILYVLRDFRRNLLFRVGTNEFIGYDQLHQLEHRPPNEQLSALKTFQPGRLSLVIEEHAHHPLFQCSLVKYRNLQERWQSRFERAVPEGQRSMFEEFKQFSSGAFVSQKDFFYRLKQMSFSDRQVQYVWDVSQKYSLLQFLASFHYTRIEAQYTQYTNSTQEIIQDIINNILLEQKLSGCDSLQSEEQDNIQQLITTTEKTETIATIATATITTTTEFLNSMSKESLLNRPAPDGFISQLRQHQEQALSWMHFREGRLTYEQAFSGTAPSQEEKLSPLWVKYRLPNGEVLYCNAFTGKLQHAPPAEIPTLGGILSDEMGLGKTLMALALIVEAKHLEPKHPFQGGTLIVVPKSLIAQWSKEIELHVGKNVLTVHTYYSPESRKKKYDLKAYDVVITTYAVLAMDFADKFEPEENNNSNDNNNQDKKKRARTPQGGRAMRGRKRATSCMHSQPHRIATDPTNISELTTTTNNTSDPSTATTTTSSTTTTRKRRAREQGQLNLFEVEFQRVVLDEAHSIKGAWTQQSRGAMKLQTRYRWCLTGTPMQNKHDDLFSLVSFLQVETFGEYFWWNQYINREENEEGQQQLLSQVLQPILLRRTKGSVEFKRTEEVVWVDLHPKERQVYDKLLEGSSQLFRQLLSTEQAGRQYIHVFQIIGKLRQACDHPFLALKDVKIEATGDVMARVERFLEEQRGRVSQISENFRESLLQELRNRGVKECTICLEDDIHSFALAPCGHFCCASCFRNLLQSSGKCPNCRVVVREDELLIVDRELDDIKSNYCEFREKRSSKIDAVVQAVVEAKCQGEKCLVFTQWIEMIELLQHALSEQGVESECITGKHSVTQREKRVTRFALPEGPTALVLSIRASSTGLNLTMANHVLIVDPWWNVEIGRNINFISLQSRTKQSGELTVSGKNEKQGFGGSSANAPLSSESANSTP